MVVIAIMGLATAGISLDSEKSLNCSDGGNSEMMEWPLTVDAMPWSAVGRSRSVARVTAMVAAHDREGFGHCTNIGECEAACPKEISVDHIARMNRDYGKAILSEQFA